MRSYGTSEDSGSKSDEELVKEAEGTAEDTIIYELKTRCKWNSNSNPKARDPKDCIDANVYSKSIKPLKREGQPQDIGLIHDDILIAKCRPGKKIIERYHPNTFHSLFLF